MKQFAHQLQTLFQERCTAGLSYLDTYRVRKEIKLVHSIKRKLNRAQCIRRVSDKSNLVSSILANQSTMTGKQKRIDKAKEPTWNYRRIR
jgi:hypothetical protein